MSRRRHAVLSLSQRPDGVVQLEIWTADPLLEPFVNHWGERFTPSEYLAWDNAFEFRPRAPAGKPCRYLKVFAQAPGLMPVDRHLDLSEGSHERAMVEAMIGQREVPIVWVNEKIETTYCRPEWGINSRLREVIESTRGLSAEEWREELEELPERLTHKFVVGFGSNSHQKQVFIGNVARICLLTGLDTKLNRW